MHPQWMKLTVVSIFFFAVMACTPIISPTAQNDTGTVPTETVPPTEAPTEAIEATDGDSNMEELTMYIAPERVECTGVAPMQCLQVKFDETAAYEFFYSGIDGFVFVPGYNYELRVQRLELDNPPADASKYIYSLIEVVDRTAAYTGDAVALEGTMWTLVAFGDEAMVLYDVDQAAITAKFEEGQFYGSAGCNDYSGGYSVENNTLVLTEVIATRMACLEESVMAAETAYFQALASVGDFALEGNILTLTYAAGQLTFIATDTMDGENTVIGELIGQISCGFAGTGGTIVVDDKRVNFTCGSPEVVLLGGIEQGVEGWLIEKAALRRQDGNFAVQESTMSIIRSIVLEDGRQCDWAGNGATLAVDGKRVNFTCGTPEDVLIGEVVMGDAGWMIETATVRQSDAGLVVEPIGMAPIVALFVAA